MNRAIIHVDTGGLSTNDLSRFSKYLSAHKGRDIEELVQVWNGYATCVEEHVFVKKTFRVSKPHGPFRLQNSYQDSGWEDFPETYNVFEDAQDKAWRCSADAVCYGMVRVVDANGVVMVTYGAGEGKRGGPPPIRTFRPEDRIDYDSGDPV